MANAGREPAKLARVGTQILTETTVTASVVNTTETLLATIATLPANFFSVGKGLRVECHGRGTYSGGGPTLILRLRYGGLAGTLLCSTGIMTVTGTGLANAGVWLQALVTGLTVGSTGTVWAMGVQGYSTATTLAGADTMNTMGSGTLGTANAAAITINTLTANDLVLTAEWSANTAGNSITFGPAIMAYEL